MRVIIFLLFILTVYAKCPDTPGAALRDSNRQLLIDCDADTLRDYYNKDDCCIVNIAECNNIEAAWQLSRNILDPTPLCNYNHKFIRGYKVY